MKLYIMRHGETKWNVKRRLQGRSDIALNENGIELAQITKEGLRDVAFDLAISSPLLRAVETANIVLGGRKIPLLLDDRIEEIGFGVWEGLSCAKEHYELPDETFKQFFEDPYQYEPPMGGESIHQILQRTQEFYEELISNEDYQDKTILISTHGCATRALLHNVYPKGQDFWRGCVPPNCSVSIIEVKEKKSTLLAEDQIYYDPDRVVSYTK